MTHNDEIIINKKPNQRMNLFYEFFCPLCEAIDGHASQSHAAAISDLQTENRGANF